MSDNTSQNISIEEAKNFLEKLAQLTHETGISISGCGCCGSPWLQRTSVRDGGYSIDERKFDELTYSPNPPWSDTFFVDRYGKVDRW